MTTLLVFATVVVIFAFALGAKRFVQRDLCALCVSVSLTWVGLLILLKVGVFENTVLVALLMGQSVTGIYYMLKERLPHSLRIFTLPFFLSLTAVSYVLITNDFIIWTFVLLTAVWIAGWVIFASRDDPGVQPLAAVVMECCERTGR